MKTPHKFSEDPGINSFLQSVELAIDDLHRSATTEQDREYCQAIMDHFRNSAPQIKCLQEWVDGIASFPRDDHWKSIMLDLLIAHSL
jgi:hypothetical protein